MATVILSKPSSKYSTYVIYCLQVETNALIGTAENALIGNALIGTASIGTASIGAAFI
jgi:hypothetical protein